MPEQDEISNPNRNQNAGDPVKSENDVGVTPTPDPVPEELQTQILSEVTLVTRVENGQQIEEITIPESLFSNVENLTICQIRSVLMQNDPNSHVLDFLKGFSPSSPLYPMKLVRNIDTDEFEVIKLPENESWVRGSWTKLQNPNDL